MVNVSRRNLLFGRPAVSNDAQSIRLPWTVSEALFIELCTRCGDCISACPERIIEQGDGGFPQLNFQQGECTFCQFCVQSCDQPFFQNEQLGQPSKAWHKVASIESGCLTQQGVFCQNCKDACESRAIVFTHRIGAVPTPVVKQEDCVACGACVAPCPSNSIQIASKERQQDIKEEVRHVSGNSYQ